VANGMAERARKQIDTERYVSLDVLRGFAVLWMTLFHFAFDLNHFGWIQQDFYRSPWWTVQRACIVSLFLLCVGMGQAIALAQHQSASRFWRRWAQIAACAVLVSAGSFLMFPNSWIYFGVLHGIALMLLVVRVSAHWGRWLWVAGAVAVAAGVFAPHLHAMLGDGGRILDARTLNWIGLISKKPITEDYAPLLPWLGVVWWGLALGQWLLKTRPNLSNVGVLPRWAQQTLAWIGRRSLSWYMVHQPILIGALTVVAWVQ
jgi:uncharacterized membrane protein